MFRIKEILREKNLTQKELADKIGMHRVTLSQTIKGNPTVETLQRIAAALDVQVIDLFEDTREPLNRLICPHCKSQIEIEVK